MRTTSSPCGSTPDVFGAPRDQVVAALVEGCANAEGYCRDGIWLPHQALLADPARIDAVVEAVTKVRTASGSLARA